MSNTENQFFFYQSNAGVTIINRDGVPYTLDQIAQIFTSASNGHPATEQLKRAADALEASTENMREWIETQSRWRKEDQGTQQRIFDQTQEWIDWQKQLLQEQTEREQRMNDLARERHEAMAREQNAAILAVYEESLKATTKQEPDIKTLANEVGKEMAQQIRQSGNVRME